MKVPVLTYHGMFISGNEPSTNDHCALKADLEVIGKEGFQVRPLREIVDCWLEDPSRLAGERVVALTCDDGSDFDFRDIEHPQWGPQRSLLNVLRDYQRENPGSQPSLHITSFVIASPQARAELDKTCMHGKGWWTDDWWPSAIESKLMDVANHSWDHNHEGLLTVAFPGIERGSFMAIDREDLAEYQVAQACEYLARRAPNPGACLFAYPYGPHSDYLEREYFPRHRRRLNVTACFGDLGRPLTADDNRWNLPRYCHMRDWREPGELVRLLRS